MPSNVKQPQKTPPCYRATRRGEPVNDWIVVALPTEANPNPAPVAEFATEKEAIARAELLNAAAGLVGDDAGRDEVLRRMLKTYPPSSMSNSK